MSDVIVRLSRADAGLLSELAEYGLVAAEDIYDYADGRRVINLLDAALAEGPERAATGETLLDWDDIDNAIAARLAADDARDAAIGGGGEGNQ